MLKVNILSILDRNIYLMNIFYMIFQKQGQYLQSDVVDSQIMLHLIFSYAEIQ